MSDNDEDPLYRTAGLPSERSNTILYAGVAIVASLPFVAILGYAIHSCASTTFADTLAEISIRGLDQPAEEALTLREGTEVVFAIDTAYSYSGNPVVMLDVSLLRERAEVASSECKMKGFTGIGATGSGSTVWYGDAGWICKHEVPKGGATSVRATVRRAGSGSLELRNTSVVVKRP